MRNIRILLGSTLAAATVCIAFGGPAGATTMKECSVKYKAAKQDGSLAAGENWKAFRAKECASGSAPATTAAAPAATATAAAPAAAAPMASSSAAVARPSAMAASSGTATFPSAMSPKYANETAGKGRMHTCLDQYKANKVSNANGGLRWIQKGGGYYSECTKKLKGA